MGSNSYIAKRKYELKIAHTLGLYQCIAPCVASKLYIS